jgi:hypothetical protein
MVGLPFFIQNLNFEEKTDKKSIDKSEKPSDEPEKHSVFYFLFSNFKRLNFVEKN